MPEPAIGASIVRGLRDNWRPAVLYFLAPVLLVPMVVVGGAAVVLTLMSDRTAITPESSDIPAEVRAAAMLEGFACLRDGPDGCGPFDDAVTFLDRISDGTFAYTPLAATDPGEALAGGQRRVELGDLTPLQARAVGAAVARTVPLPSSAAMTATRTGDNLETVTFVRADLRGTVTFARGAGNYRLRSITYRPESKADR